LRSALVWIFWLPLEFSELPLLHLLYLHRIHCLPIKLELLCGFGALRNRPLGKPARGFRLWRWFLPMSAFNLFFINLLQ
jgi:hypothetical protein